MNPRSIHFWRRLVQFGTVVAFTGISILNLRGSSLLSGNFLSFNLAGFTLSDPMSALQVLLGALSIPGKLTLGASVALLLALLLGPVFCSWLCPYGLLSELAHRKGKGPAGGVAEEINNPGPFKLKLGLTTVGLILVLTLAPSPLLNQLSMPGWITRFIQHIALYREVLWGAALAPAILLLELVFSRRFWCRYLCPQSVLLNLCGLILPHRLAVCFERTKCTCPASDRVCGQACHLGLDPRRPGRNLRLQCSNCGDCVDACRKRGQALDLKAGGKQ